MPLLRALLVRKIYVQCYSWNTQVSYKGKQSSEHVCLQRKFKKKLTWASFKTEIFIFFNIKKKVCHFILLPSSWVLASPSSLWSTYVFCQLECIHELTLECACHSFIETLCPFVSVIHIFFYLEWNIYITAFKSH